MPTRVIWRREERSHINAQINCTAKAEREKEGNAKHMKERANMVGVQNATETRGEESEIRSERGGKGGEDGPWPASET